MIYTFSDLSFLIPKCPGIYKILNLSNNKIYIGSSTNLRARFQHHKSRLNNKHWKNCNI